MNIGLDIHGVIDRYPEFFSKFTYAMTKVGCKIYILTGAMITSELIDQLKKWDIHYHKIFSITNYLIENNVPVNFEDANNPWFPEYAWNKAKGDYCYAESINFHVDDTKEYGKHFHNGCLFVHIDDFIKTQEIQSNLSTAEPCIKFKANASCDCFSNGWWCKSKPCLINRDSNENNKTN